MNILQYTNSRNLCIFSCIFSRATTVDSFTTLSILTQISSTQKFEKTRPKSFKVLLTMLSQSVQRDSQIPTEPKPASLPALPKSGPLAQRTKNNSSNSNSYPTFPPKTAKNPFSVFSIIVGKTQTEFSWFRCKRIKEIYCFDLKFSQLHIF